MPIVCFAEMLEVAAAAVNKQLENVNKTRLKCFCSCHLLCTTRNTHLVVI